VLLLLSPPISRPGDTTRGDKRHVSFKECMSLIAFILAQLSSIQARSLAQAPPVQFLCVTAPAHPDPFPGQQVARRLHLILRRRSLRLPHDYSPILRSSPRAGVLLPRPSFDVDLASVGRLSTAPCLSPVLPRTGCVLRGFRGSWAPPQHRIQDPRKASDAPPLLAAGRSSCCLNVGFGSCKRTKFQIRAQVHCLGGLRIARGFEFPPPAHSFVIVPAVINNNRFELLDQRKGYQLGQFQRTTPRDVAAGPRCLSALQPGFAEQFPVPLHAASARPAPNGMHYFRGPLLLRARGRAVSALPNWSSVFAKAATACASS
jgi:hypothetical protein